MSGVILLGYEQENQDNGPGQAATGGVCRKWAFTVCAVTAGGRFLRNCAPLLRRRAGYQVYDCIETGERSQLRAAQGAETKVGAR